MAPPPAPSVGSQTALFLAPPTGKSKRRQAVDSDLTFDVEARALRKASVPPLGPKPRNARGQVKGAAPPPAAAVIGGRSRTYSHDREFDQGSYRNVVHRVPDRLELDDSTTPLHFMWVAVSSKGTIVKIDTDTGKLLGEYRSAPFRQGSDPSRTVVDQAGNVWVGNRGDSSVVHIGLVENHQCIDRNRNGQIDTSTGLGDVLDWSNAGGLDTGGGVATAIDECILHYVIVDSSGTRHLSLTADDDLWVSGTGDRRFDLIDGLTGTISRREGPVGQGGFGGLVDARGVLWSARPLLRWDTARPLTEVSAGRYDHDSYGLCIDSKGQVWNTALEGAAIRKFAARGRLLATYRHGSEYAQGCAIDRQDHVWVAHSLLGDEHSVGHLLPDGTWVGNVEVGRGPTGVTVDARGKIWVTNFHDQTVSRIDPLAGPPGKGGVPVGAVDFTTVELGGLPSDYGDMTGPSRNAAPSTGSWRVIHDSETPGANWGEVSWTQKLVGDGVIRVLAASSEDGVEFGPAEEVGNGVDLLVADGRYLEVTTLFQRSSEGVSPVLFDLTIEIGNEPPDCSKATPSVAQLRPNRRAFVPVTIEGLSDPEDDPLTVTITGILQDEPLDSTGDARFVPDGKGVGTPVALLRAERAWTRRPVGKGRVYELRFTARDPGGRTCQGSVNVGVHRKRAPAIDDGARFDSSQIP